MALHKYKVGQVVDFIPGRLSMPASRGAYKIVKLMPSDSGENLYRVKCATESFERMAKETELLQRTS